MGLPSRTLLMRLTAGMLAAFVAGLIYAPGPARAACGDYVTLGSKSAAQTMKMAAHNDARHPATQGHTTPAQKRTPCSGPQCSRSAPSSEAPSAPPVRVRTAN